MRLILVLTLLTLAACANRPTEREIFTQGLREGFKMGHAPQILPIQVEPVRLTPSPKTAEEFLRGLTDDLAGGLGE